ncbi:hypothetical protein MNBD_PLANCTO02-865 [hydrothermal vent metagenome]|uniref:Cytochrome c domain-containing protein n=1 Tax=hydrothermal vent metagenome TaxID=652676 RepID=A0A3B1DDT1_9ZZZZ
MRIYFSILSLLFFVTITVAIAQSESKIRPSSKEEIKFFETEVRPLLAVHCYKCHGAEKQKGELRVDSLQALLKGGESGAAIVPRKPDESLLIEAINHDSFEMPEKKLSDKNIAILTKWIKQGAPWSSSNAKPFDWSASPRKRFTKEDRSFWIFQPVKTLVVPRIENREWSKNPIDRFIYKKLKQSGLSPAPQADRLTLIRRASFDLIGLPPTSSEVDDFLKDKENDDVAFSKVVDRLLMSPHYGERWGRHWLDLVRYAESDGFNQDAYRPTAWRYRDYVIDAFNDDKPYNKFVMEQLAGDEIAPDDPQAQIATGYLRHYIYEYNQRDARTQWNDILNNVTDTTGEVFLGFGMSCARCHDHKFDPILQSDYFRLKAFFVPMMPRDETVIASKLEKAEYNKKLKIWEKKTASIRLQIDSYLEKRLKKVATKQIKMFPPDIQEIMKKPMKERTTHEMQLAYLVNRQVIDEQKKYRKKIIKQKKYKKYAQLVKELSTFNRFKPLSLPTAPAVSDNSTESPATLIPGRKQAKDILPGFPSILEPVSVFVQSSSSMQSTGRRTALAQWITNPKNRVTTRVITNRIWQYHFGTGFVATSNDFGHLGELPSHPELLDWLTSRFVREGWSFKKMHRLIMNSATYKLSATHPHPEKGLLKDPANRLHWRRGIRRLNAEQIRDSALAASGELDQKLKGPSVKGNAPRRSIYVRVKRNRKDPVLGAFDFAGGITSTSKRHTTTTPTQALLMINGRWMRQRASAMGKRILKSAKTTPERIKLAYRLAYGRKPTQSEQKMSISFMKNQIIKNQSNTPLTDMCHVLLNSNEFSYID